MRIKIHPEICSGCKTCEIVCSLNRCSKVSPGESNVRVKNSYETGRRQDIPGMCRNCRTAYCAVSCPANAIRVKNGMVVLYPDLCDNCGKCIEKCPFGSIFMNENHEVTKCNFCEGEILCARFCSTGAIEAEK